MNAPDPITQAISPVEVIVAEMAAGRMVILVDEEDRENEGDLVLAADHVTPAARPFRSFAGPTAWRGATPATPATGSADMAHAAAPTPVPQPRSVTEVTRRAPSGSAATASRRLWKSASPG